MTTNESLPSEKEDQEEYETIHGGATACRQLHIPWMVECAGTHQQEDSLVALPA